MDGSSTCASCDPGYYNQAAQLSYCLQCSPGTYTDPARRACFSLNQTFPYNLSLVLNTSILQLGTRRRKGIFSAGNVLHDEIQWDLRLAATSTTKRTTTVASPRTTTSSGGTLLTWTCAVTGAVNGYATCMDTTASCCKSVYMSSRRSESTSSSRCSDYEVNQIDDSKAGLILTVYLLKDVTGFINLALLQKNTPGVLQATAPVQAGVFVCGAPTSCNASDPSQLLYCDSNYTTKCCEKDSSFLIDSGTCIQNRKLCSAGTVYGSVGSFTACFMCTPSFYSNVSGATACSFCKPGTYSDNVGATACIDCPAGWFCSSYSKRQCNVSYFCPGLISPPILCPEGYYCRDPSQISKCNSSQCCAEGSTEPKDCTAVVAQVASVMAVQLGLPADHITQWNIGIALTADQACMASNERNAAVRIYILSILALASTAVADVAIASSTVVLGQITCNTGSSRRAFPGSGAVGTFKTLVAFQVSPSLLACT